MNYATKLTFDDLVKRYRQPLAAAAYHLCGNRESAQDIVQETLVDAYKGFNGLREPEKAGAWLYAILRRKAIAHRRARRSEARLVSQSKVSAQEPAESLVRGLVIERMTSLTEEDREILAGKYLLGLSYKELAESLGIKESAVGVRCFRAMERLRTVLRDAGVGVPQQRNSSAQNGCNPGNSAGGEKNGV